VPLGVRLKLELHGAHDSTPRLHAQPRSETRVTGGQRARQQERSRCHGRTNPHTGVGVVDGMLAWEPDGDADGEMKSDDMRGGGD
jgi:hypothetical protein